jgi:hypothetical protein
MNHQSPADEKRFHLRRLRFAAFRLGVFSHPGARELFRRLLAAPWLVLPHITARALRFYRAADLLREGLKSPIAFVRVKCAQELGHLADEASKPLLWNIAGQGDDVERLAATEALLRIGTYTDGERGELLNRIGQEQQPYILKNLVLMLPQAAIRDWKQVIETTVRRCPHRVLVDSASWALQHPKDSVFSVPDVEPPYTRKTRYPDLEFYPVYFEGSG